MLLLEAPQFTATDNPEFEWEPNTRRYRFKETGRFLSAQAVQALTVKRISLVALDLQAVGNLLLDGKISLDAWQRQTAETLKILHAQQYLLGAGGQNAIESEDYLTIGRKLKEQYGYLRNFAVDCKSGISPLQFRHRLALYAKASKGTYFAGVRAGAKRAGKTHAIRKLGDTEHCNDCKSYAARGLVPIDEAVLPTEKCSCGTNCACNILFTTLEEALQAAKLAGGILPPADFASFQIEYQEEIEFTADGSYIVDKNGRWRDKNGRFIEMPDINDPQIKSHIKGKLAEGKDSEARNVVRDIGKLKLLDLKTPQAYKATVDRLRSKYKNSPFALSVINSLQLDRGVSNKANAGAKIKELEKLIAANDEVNASPSLNQKLRAIGLTQIPISDDARLSKLEAELEGKTGEQVLKDKAALETIKQYRSSVEELNQVLSEVQNSPNLSDSDYQQLFERREKVWQNMKSALDSAQDTKDNFLSEPVLDNYMDTLRRVSRETPGGFKIVIPTNPDNLKEKAKAMPC